MFDSSDRIGAPLLAAAGALKVCILQLNEPHPVLACLGRDGESNDAVCAEV